MTAPEGIFIATVRGAELVEGYQGKLVAEFECEFKSGDETYTVTCKHDLEGEFSKATQSAFEMVGLAWPGGVRDMSVAVGAEVEIRVKHNSKNGKQYVNAYINAPYSKPAPPNKIESFIARTKGDGPSF
jgi:hypothetical protein